MINPLNSFGYIRETGPVRQAPAAPVQPGAVDDVSDAALEQFLSSWSSGDPGAGTMSLDQMLAVQAATNPELPKPQAPKISDPTDHAMRQIEGLVRDNRDVFKRHTPVSVDGWNIAG